MSNSSATRIVHQAPVSPRHILHVFPTFEVGGSQMRLTHLVRGLGADHRHTVLAMHDNFACREHFDAGAPVEFALAPRGRDLLSRLAAYRGEIARRAPDVLVTYNWGAIEWAAANLCSAVPHIHIVDGFGPDEAKQQFARRVWARRVLLKGSRLVAPSTKLRDIAINTWGVPARRALHIPNGIDPRDGFATRLESLASDLPADRTRVVWAGAMRREKNLTRLLKAFSPLRDQATLILIGDGVERATAEAQARALGVADSVRFLGQRRDARDLIMQCDLLALSSDTEQMPIAVLEAMDAGLAVVSTDVGDVEAMVSTENRMFVVSSDDAFGAALHQLVIDQGLRRRLGSANRRRARLQFSLDAMCAAYRSVFAP